MTQKNSPIRKKRALRTRFNQARCAPRISGYFR